MKCGSRSCTVMLNYRLISVSATTLYVFIRIHVESFNVVYGPCNGETRLRQYVAWVSGSSDPASACAVFGYHRGQGTIMVFPKRGPYFSVYAVIMYQCLFVNCRH